ncbi:MAG: M6 family metalloprotease domain-containing protein [candidate division Zixibacteria bacterium]|nr:M6 family metalloprotease domain-containing protein [candidate division Zixibacteria bacterium]
MRRANSYRIAAALAVIILLGLSSAYAVQPSDEVLQKLADEGRLDAYIAAMQDAKARGMNTPTARMRSRSLALGAEDDTVDTVRVCVLLVDFVDKQYTDGYLAATTTQFDSVLFSTGNYNSTGSMTEFYMENSYGKFFIIGDIYGWYRMDKLYSYYVGPGESHGGGVYPANTQGMTIDLIAQVDDDIDFSQYDYSGPDGYPDGEVDGLFIVHAGTGYEESGNDSEIHSHMWWLGQNSVTADGVKIDKYTCEPEESAISQGISPIGVFCHEYGHFLGLPDLYDIADTDFTSAGLGKWSLMAGGSYNGNSRKPAHFDAWCKMMLGYLTPTEIPGNMTGVEIPQVETEPVAYKLWADGDYTGTEYFLIENRQQVGFDNALPGSGLCIYHVDETAGSGFMGSNDDPEHYHVALEQADGLFQLEYALNSKGDGGDPFPGFTNARHFDDKTTPNSRGYGDVITKVAVWDISDSDSLMTANMDVTWSQPYFTFTSIGFDDENGNDIYEAGETISFYFNLQNDWLTASNAVITLNSNDPAIAFVNPDFSFDNFPGDGFNAGNPANPITFMIPDTITPRFDSFFVTVESDGGAYGASFGMEIIAGKPQILLVDADRGGSYEQQYYGDFYRLKLPVHIWDKEAKGTPPFTTLSDYRVAVWFTGETSSNVITGEDIDVITDYLDNHGNLFITGQRIATELHAEDSVFLDTYLHAAYNTTYFAPYHRGVEGSPLGSALYLRYSSSFHQDIDASASIIPVDGAVPALTFQGGGYSAICYNVEYKLVYFNFGFEDIQNEMPRWDFRDTVLAHIMDFFEGVTTDIYDGGGFASIPNSFSLAQNYPNPFNPTTTISYALHNTGGKNTARTKLEVINILGQHVKTLVDEVQGPGNYSVVWDGSDDNGGQTASGIYFYRLQRGNNVESKKMIFLK